MMDHGIGMMGPPFPTSHDMMMQHGMMKGGSGTEMMDHGIGMMMGPHPPGMNK
jgi:hypothetical protein